jgi:hypothetical protein
MKLYRVLTLLLAVVLILSACNLPNAASPTAQTGPEAVYTAAAQTIEAKLTQDGLLNPTSPPSSTPVLVTNTPPAVPSNTLGPLPATTSAPVVLPTAACDTAQFVSDITIPDGTVFAAGATFTKTWRLKNIGTCTWNTSYALTFDSLEAMGGAGSSALAGTTPPGSTLDVSVNLQAPTKDGTYRGYWGITNASGARIPIIGGSNGKSFYVEIKVGTGTSSGTTSPTSTGGATATPTDASGKFAVMSVGFTVSHTGDCTADTGNYVIIATITANKAGTVNFTWVSSDDTGPSTSDTITFDSAGSKTINIEWVTMQAASWVDLYIDKPNHQQFGRANLACQ